MGDFIKKHMSQKNQYYIHPARMKELRWFCMQYDEYRKRYDSLLEGSLLPVSKYDRDAIFATDPWSIVDTTAIKRASYKTRMELIQEAVVEADFAISEYIFLGVTKNLSYDKIRAQHPEIPCGKEYYYKKYRKFFYILDKKRD